MQPTDSDQPDDRKTDSLPDDAFLVGEAMLARARSVVRRIDERCRQVSGDSPTHPASTDGGAHD